LASADGSSYCQLLPGRKDLLNKITACAVFSRLRIKSLWASNQPIC